MSRFLAGRIVLTNREPIIALDPRGKGIMGTLLRFPCEIRDEKPYFEGISDAKLGKDAMELAKHIVQTNLHIFIRSDSRTATKRLYAI
jgi:DNA end-binding protein Ku